MTIYKQIKQHSLKLGILAFALTYWATGLFSPSLSAQGTFGTFGALAAVQTVGEPKMKPVARHIFVGKSVGKSSYNSGFGSSRGAADAMNWAGELAAAAGQGEELNSRQQADGQGTLNESSSSAASSEPTVPKAWQDYPMIPELNQSLGIFKQFLIEVEENKKRWAQNNSLLPITLYVYPIHEGDSIFSISAKTSISVESIATLNRIEHPSGLPRARSYILIPNNSGIFLPRDQSRGGAEAEPYQSLSAWEQQLRENREPLLFHRLVIGQRIYFYYPRGQFSQKERRYFLDNIFRSPVQNRFYITSPFGLRRDPITGKNSFHDGLDLRSPYGAPVYSIANGTVLDSGESRLYGLYVKIRLDNGKEQVALYGHLIAVLVRKGQRVNAGEVVGNSGKSGRSTGPHLHLTIFEKGKPIDPAPLFRGSY